MSTLGNNIRQHRQDRNMSLQELAFKIRCGVHTVQEYESGIRTPDNGTLLKISTALDVSTSQLLNKPTLNP
ncbi:MAG: helix-turn-helix domain-containing protein [Bacillus sp. (in: firmicutes)]